MTTEERLVEYVRRALERREAGESVDVDELCSDHPELSDAVQEALQLQQTVDLDLDADPLLDEVLNDRYELLECIGTGAMGAVYRAGDRTLGREVAVKILQPGVLNSADRRKRFVREAQVLASLEHPGIVTVFDHGHTATGLSFLVMPRLVGIPMSAIILDAEDRSGPDGSIDLPSSRALTERFGIDCAHDFIPQIATWFADLAQALGAAHGARVFHRDVKPSNIFVTSEGKAVLIDFGIAARVDDVTLTAEGSTLGTPWYMSPEQAERRETATPQVDVYGMCATMYHLLAMRPPYDGLSAEVLNRLRKEDPPALKSLRRTLPTDLCAIVEKGLERNPRDRYHDMAAFEADLRGFLAGQPIVARPLSRAARAWRRVRRRPLPAMVVLLLLICCVAAVLTTSYVRDQELKQAEQYRQGVAALPPSLAIEGTLASRGKIPGSERTEMITRLSAILDLRPSDVNTRLLRSALAQDEGSTAASAADIAYLSRMRPTPYLEELSQRYSKVEDGSQGVGALDLGDLPALETDLDHTVAAFHLIRNKDEAAAYRLLGEASEYAPARYMRINTFLSVAASKRDQELLELTREMREELLELRKVFGDTARILYVDGTLAIMVKNHEQAISSLQRAATLSAQQSYGPLYNLGHTLLITGQFDAAEAAMLKARDLRPWNLNAHLKLAEINAANGEFEAAMKLANELPEEGSLLQPWYRAYLMGYVANLRFTHLLGEGRVAEARDQATGIVQHFTACLDRVPQSDRGVRQTIRIYIWDAKLYLSGDDRYFQRFLAQMRNDPLNPHYLKSLAKLLETEELDATARKRLVDVINAQLEARKPPSQSK